MTLYKDQWEDIDVPTLEIALDDENPRLDPFSRSSQDAIIQYLIEHEGVIPLAKQINSFKGLFPQERVILIPGSSGYTVIEGNRRVTACKILLKPYLSVHSHWEKEIPIIDDITRNNIRSIPATIAATRAIADEVVASLHLNGGKLDWTDIGQIRYTESRFLMGRSIEELARELSVTEETIKNLLSRGKAYRAIQGLEWKSHERDILWDFRIDIQPLMRICFSPLIKKHFGVELFLHDGSLNYMFQDFEKVLRAITKHCIISQRIKEMRRVYKDANIQDYLNEVFPRKNTDKEKQIDFFEKKLPAPSKKNIDKSESEKNIPEHSQQQAEERKISPQSTTHHRPELFFEHLNCRQNDVHMRLLCRELRRVNVEDFRFSASFLMRVTFEWCLRYHLIQTGHWKILEEKHKKPKLSHMMSYAAIRENKVFPNENMANKVQDMISQGRINDLNYNAHDSIGNHSPERLREIAGDLRPFIRYIAEDAQY
ncbi:sigma-70 region 4 domain-containing protein [Azospirillum lipoferum]|uniref:ParB/Sulfiredoxin domain-containing protein n=1 Tax=Azospirillum lipoferum (strain 4B) TaxID=862719 RepID=G7Z5T0_AZOL4|nr:sigma-70 region 4 domain-containing protein [Azospirillum lipoferum]CBS86274.1 protein of unknown function [Azospirillum lipoferum 4B]